MNIGAKRKLAESSVSKDEKQDAADNLKRLKTDYDCLMSELSAYKQKYGAISRFESTPQTMGTPFAPGTIHTTDETPLSSNVASNVAATSSANVVMEQVEREPGTPTAFDLNDQ